MWRDGQRWLRCSFFSSKKSDLGSNKGKAGAETVQLLLMRFVLVCRSFCVRTTSASSPIWPEWSHMSSFMPLTTVGPTWTGSATSDIWLVLRWAPVCSALAVFMCSGNFGYCVIQFDPCVCGIMFRLSWTNQLQNFLFDWIVGYS